MGANVTPRPVVVLWCIFLASFFGALGTFFHMILSGPQVPTHGYVEWHSKGNIYFVLPRELSLFYALVWVTFVSCAIGFFYSYMTRDNASGG